jgi:hypothetical protein
LLVEAGGVDKIQLPLERVRTNLLAFLFDAPFHLLGGSAAGLSQSGPGGSGRRNTGTASVLARHAEAVLFLRLMRQTVFRPKSSRMSA